MEALTLVCDVALCWSWSKRATSWSWGQGDDGPWVRRGLSRRRRAGSRRDVGLHAEANGPGATWASMLKLGLTSAGWRSGQIGLLHSAWASPSSSK
ncbi:unnamed protein product [Prunus armeniaca]